MQGSYKIEKYIVFQKSICKVCCLDLLELAQMSAVQYSSAGNTQKLSAIHSSAVTGGSKQLWLVRQLQPTGRQAGPGQVGPQRPAGKKGCLAGWLYEGRRAVRLQQSMVLILKGIKKLSETSLRKSEAKPQLGVNTGLGGCKAPIFLLLMHFSIKCIYQSKQYIVLQVFFCMYFKRILHFLMKCYQSKHCIVSKVFVWIFLSVLCTF